MITVLRLCLEILGTKEQQDDSQKEKMAEKEELYGAAPTFGPCAVKGLKVGETKHWCRCGLSKTQPWCDGSHKGTGIGPMLWKVDKEQEVFYICACKQTKNPPFCDGSHNDAPGEMKARKAACASKDGHVTDCKLCTKCGWAPDF